MPTDYEEIFRQKFSKVHAEIESVQDMLTLKKGGWIFTRHTYSKEDLLRLPQFKRIRTICRKIGADIIAWTEAGNFSEEGRKEYQRARKRVAKSFNELRKAIQNREATALDKALELFDQFVSTVNDLLPTLTKIVRLGTKILAAKNAPYLLN